MEKEQIVKALERCIEGECDGCDYDEQTACKEYLLNDALSLILEQDKRIEELEKEAAFREGEADNAIDIAEGNIRAEIASGGTSCHWCEDKIKADTVTKMQEKFTMHFGTYTPKDEVKISEVFRLLGKFAEEMLEGKDEE